MNALKGVVIIMSVLIAILMTLMAYGLYQKSQNPDFKFFNYSGSEKAPSEVMPEAPVSGSLETAPMPNTAFGDITLDLPKGASIVSASPSGAQLIIITASDGVRADQVWMLDTTSGKVLGRVYAGQ